jgi:transcriptional regulator with XRE-family HTH domain
MRNYGEAMEFTFAELLVSYRKRVSMKQQQLADALGRSRTTVSNWERGETLPEDRDIFRMLQQELSLTKDETNKLMVAACYLPDIDERPGIVNHGEATTQRIIYDSNVEVPSFSSWLRFSTVNGHDERIRVIRRPQDGMPAFELIAFSSEFVGVHRNLATVYGKVTFEYKWLLSATNTPNVVFYVIPVKEAWRNGRPEPMELGEDIPQAQLSYRKKFLLLHAHLNDGQWHQATLEFDFREISSVNYCIFAPRINEGCTEHGAAHVLVSNIQVVV